MNIYIILGISLLFIAIGFIITPNNAKTLLSGYNSMSTQERDNFLIEDFLKFFKLFHIFLGISFFLLSFFIIELFDEIYFGLFVSIYPLLFYVYMIFRSKKFYKNNDLKKNWKENLSIIILVAVLIFIVGLFYYSIKDNHVKIENNNLIIEGIYGDIFPLDQIENVKFIDSIPKNIKKENGIIVGEIVKGNFEINSNEIALFYINNNYERVLEIQLHNQKKIFVGDKKNVLIQILQNLNQRK